MRIIFQESQDHYSQVNFGLLHKAFHQFDECMNHSFWETFIVNLSYDHWMKIAVLYFCSFKVILLSLWWLQLSRDSCNVGSSWILVAMIKDNLNGKHVGNMSLLEHHFSQTHTSTQNMLVLQHHHAANLTAISHRKWSQASKKGLSSSLKTFRFSLCWCLLKSSWLHDSDDRRM